MERETIVRWDETSELAYLWTASRHTRRLSQQLGYTIQDEPGGWAVRLPKHLIGFKPAKGPFEPVAERPQATNPSTTESNLAHSDAVLCES